MFTICLGLSHIYVQPPGAKRNSRKVIAMKVNNILKIFGEDLVPFSLIKLDVPLAYKNTSKNRDCCSLCLKMHLAEENACIDLIKCDSDIYKIRQNQHQTFCVISRSACLMPSG